MRTGRSGGAPSEPAAHDGERAGRRRGFGGRDKQSGEPRSTDALQSQRRRSACRVAGTGSAGPSGVEALLASRRPTHPLGVEARIGLLSRASTCAIGSRGRGSSSSGLPDEALASPSMSAKRRFSFRPSMGSRRQLVHGGQLRNPGAVPAHKPKPVLLPGLRSSYAGSGECRVHGGMRGAARACLRPRSRDSDDRAHRRPVG